MKRFLYAILVTLVGFKVNAQAGPISLAQAAELSAHRTDRLVTIGKIDAGFIKRMAAIEVFKVTGAPPTAFRSVVSQTATNGTNPLQLEITLDGNGNALTYKVLPNGVAGPDPLWPKKSAAGLIENGLHYVLDNKTTASVVPYFDNLKSLKLSATNLAGQNVAAVTMTSNVQSQKLNVFLNLDGTFNSSKITP